MDLGMVGESSSDIGIRLVCSWSLGVFLANSLESLQIDLGMVGESSSDIGIRLVCSWSLGVFLENSCESCASGGLGKAEMKFKGALSRSLNKASQVRINSTSWPRRYQNYQEQGSRIEEPIPPTQCKEPSRSSDVQKSLPNVTTSSS